MRGIFRVDHFCQDEVGEGFSLSKRGTERYRRAENRHFFAPRHGHLVLSVVGTGIDSFHHDENVLKLGTYPTRTER